jgi:hypothetical protein
MHWILSDKAEAMVQTGSMLFQCGLKNSAKPDILRALHLYLE